MRPLRARRAKRALGGMAEGSGAMAASAAAAASQDAACADADGLGGGVSLGPSRLHPPDHVHALLPGSITTTTTIINLHSNT